MDLRYSAAVPAVGVTTDGETSLHQQTRKKNFIRVIKALCVFAVVTILSLAVLMSGVFRAFAEEYRTPANSRVFGLSIGNLTIPELGFTLQEIKNSTFNVVLSDGSMKSYRLSDIGIVFNPEDTALQAGEANSKLWNGEELQPNLWRNEQVLKDFVNKALVGAADPVNATFEIRDGKVEIKESVPGWGASFEEVVSKVEVALASKKPMQLSGQAIPAAITTEQLQMMQARAQAFADREISVGVGEETVNIKNYEVMEFTVDQETDAVEYGFSADKLTTKLQEVADLKSVPVWNELYTGTADQKNIVRPGKEGVTYSGLEEAVSDILSDGNSTKDRNVTLVRSATAFQSLEKTAANTWIDVNLTTHQMTLWENGEVHRIIPISGGKPETPSPIGDFKITSKTRKMTMSGPGYATPNVEYISWFKFNYAIHSAYWHEKFGQANVSLGCINAPTDEAKYVYEWAPIDTKVSVHY